MHYLWTYSTWEIRRIYWIRMYHQDSAYWEWYYDLAIDIQYMGDIQYTEDPQDLLDKNAPPGLCIRSDTMS